MKVQQKYNAGEVALEFISARAASQFLFKGGGMYVWMDAMQGKMTCRVRPLVQCTTLRIAIFGCAETPISFKLSCAYHRILILMIRIRDFNVNITNHLTEVMRQYKGVEILSMVNGRS